MSANLNLASNPFRNRVLPWTITVVIASVSLVLLVFIVNGINQSRAQATAVERDVKKLQAQFVDLQKRATEIKDSLTPEQRQALEAAHALYDRKHFSWSRLLADLESALPGSVRVTRINVRDVVIRGGQTVATLEVAVVSKNPDDVTRMIADMDQTAVFQGQLVAENQQKGKGETGTEITLSLRYTPRMRSKTAKDTGNESVASVGAGEATGVHTGEAPGVHK